MPLTLNCDECDFDLLSLAGNLEIICKKCYYAAIDEVDDARRELKELCKRILLLENEAISLKKSKKVSKAKCKKLMQFIKGYEEPSCIGEGMASEGMDCGKCLPCQIRILFKKLKETSDGN